MRRKGGIIVNDSDTPSISFRNKQQMSTICLLMYVWQHMVVQKGQGITASQCSYENNRHITPLTVAFYVFKIKGLDEDYSLSLNSPQIVEFFFSRDMATHVLLKTVITWVMVWNTKQD